MYHVMLPALDQYGPSSFTSEAATYEEAAAIVARYQKETGRWHELRSAGAIAGPLAWACWEEPDPAIVLDVVER